MPDLGPNKCQSEESSELTKSSAWAGGTGAIIERMDKMTMLFIEEAQKSIYYKGESAINCEECGAEIRYRKVEERLLPVNSV